MMNSDHLKAARIVYAVYGKNMHVQAERRLDSWAVFDRFFQGQPGFDRKAFFQACMQGTIVEAEGIAV